MIPSADDNLYAVDILTAKNLWVFPSGGPIDQAPLVAGEEIYCVNQAGYLTQLDPATGNVRWSTLTQGGRIEAVGATKIYLRSWNNDLYIIDRATGQVLADPAATRQRAGLNLREFGLSMINRYDDRILFGTDSGMILCLRELGADPAKAAPRSQGPAFRLHSPRRHQANSTSLFQSPRRRRDKEKEKEQAPKEEPLRPR